MITKIEELKEELRNIYIYGIVKDIEIRKRRSDGQELAFFNIEDNNGCNTIECRCFTQVYEKYKHLIKEKRKVLLNGDCILDTKPIEHYVFNMKNGIAI